MMRRLRRALTGGPALHLGPLTIATRARIAADLRDAYTAGYDRGRARRL